MTYDPTKVTLQIGNSKQECIGISEGMCVPSRWYSLNDLGDGTTRVSIIQSSGIYSDFTLFNDSESLNYIKTLDAQDYSLLRKIVMKSGVELTPDNYLQYAEVR